MITHNAKHIIELFVARKRKRFNDVPPNAHIVKSKVLPTARKSLQDSSAPVWGLPLGLRPSGQVNLPTLWRPHWTCHVFCVTFAFPLHLGRWLLSIISDTSLNISLPWRDFPWLLLFVDLFMWIASVFPTFSGEVHETCASICLLFITLFQHLIPHVTLNSQ